MIERWFPCAEVSEQSARGWGRGFAEKSLFTWFASRPLAQAKAAVICSLLPWPDDADEQERLKNLVRKAMTDYDAANRELRDELAKHYPNGAKLCDPFSGRAMIPLEAARLGVKAWGIDYSPVATLAGMLLADWPMQDWDDEPDLPFDGYQKHKTTYFAEPRLLQDVRFVLDLVGDRYEQAMGEFYPKVNGKRPWGYVWAITLPCVNCGNRFPLTGSLKLRNAKVRKDVEDPGQSYRIVADAKLGKFWTIVHDGPPTDQPTLINIRGKRGKTAICSFCQQAHPLDTLKRLMRDDLAEDALLVVADIDADIGKRYRKPSQKDFGGLLGVEEALAVEPPLGPGLSSVPTEALLPGLSAFIGPAGYGYDTWGKLCNARQTLGFARLVRVIDGLFREMTASGISPEYATALSGYSASNLVRRLKYSTRGASLQTPRQCVGHIYVNDSGISHGFDYFETSTGVGPATWSSLVVHTTRNLQKQLSRVNGDSAIIQRGSATELPILDGSLDAVVTDPPYDAMINYCDSSDLLFVWLKRALATAMPWFGITSDPNGLQEKTNEAVVKFGSVGDDHRTEAHYKATITKALDQTRIKTRPDGVVSIVFGHGDPDAWTRVLTAITDAGLVLTGSWPCSTEKGGKQTGQFIDNTIMMATRAAQPDRPIGDLRFVSEQIREEIAQRVPVWTEDGLADSDQRMAAIAPAMEVVGRYENVLNFTGQQVPIEMFLGLAHQAVEDAADIRIDKFRLVDFDERTRFALSWARLYGRRVGAGSAARWQRLSYDVTEADVAGILVKTKGGQRLALGADSEASLDIDSSLIDVLFGIARLGRDPREIATFLHDLGRETDEQLWAAMGEMSRLVGEADQDGQTWTWTVRNRNFIREQAARTESDSDKPVEVGQGSLL
ncbi:MAG: DUF1156 domain-containing protein [Acidimicrobiia bacterium]|nr:DUF1156 domain-containing protein [Acidimicrobiia bacterium]